MMASAAGGVVPFEDELVSKLATTPLIVMAWTTDVTDETADCVS